MITGKAAKFKSVCPICGAKLKFTSKDILMEEDMDERFPVISCPICHAEHRITINGKTITLEEVASNGAYSK